MGNRLPKNIIGFFLLGAILALGVSGAFIATRYALGATTSHSVTLTGTPDPTQVHYRWRNDDGGEQAAALVWATTTNYSASSDYLRSVLVDGEYIYVAGQIGWNGDEWRLERRFASSGALSYAVTSSITNYATINDIAMDSAYIYLGGRDDDVNWWRLEKRAKSDGALLYVVTSTGGLNSEGVASIALDTNYIYLIGSSVSTTEDWTYVEKHQKSNGAVVTSFASSGRAVLEGGPVYNDYSIVSDEADNAIYAHGMLRVRKLNATDGTVIWSTTTDQVLWAGGMALDSAYVYFAGLQAGANDKLAVEKRLKSTGALVWSTSSEADPYETIWDMQIDSTYLYAVGEQGGGERWRLEKRRLSDGFLTYVTTSNPTNATTGEIGYDIAIDGTYMYLVGAQSSSEIGRIEKRTLGHDTSTATFAANEDTSLAIGRYTGKRLRMEIANAGTDVATDRYLLEYSTSTGGPWTSVGSVASSSAHWLMRDSAYLTDGDTTYNISPGLTDGDTTFTNGFLKDTSPQAATSTLGVTNFTELEYSLVPTSTAQIGQTYYFRLTDSGTATATYSIYASATIANDFQVTAVTVNNGSAVTPIANGTTSVTVNYQVTGGGGCGPVFYGGNVTTTLYRSGVSSTCATATSPTNLLNCYIATTSTHNCASATSTATANATSTFQVWYFAEATDASSSWSGENWRAAVFARDGSNNTANSSSASGAEMNTLLAISTATSSLNYGTVLANTNTGSTNQESSIKNAGNASTTLQVSGNALNAGANSIPTSSQHYATSSFTYSGGEQQLQSAATAVGGWVAQAVSPKNWLIATTDMNQGGGGFFGAPAVVVRQYLYRLGGSEGTAVDKVLFAPINATGSLGAEVLTTQLPGDRYGTSFATVVNERIYAIGGMDYDSITPSSSVIFGVPSATGSIPSWATTTPLPNPRGHHAVLSQNNYVYVLGGYTSLTAVTSSALLGSVSETGTIIAWTSTTPMPSALQRHAAAITNSHIYVAGGLSANVTTPATSSIFYAPVGATGSLGAWATTTVLPYGLQSYGMIADSNVLYIYGGSVVDNTTYTSTVLFAPILSDGSLGSWSYASSMPIAAYGFGYTSHNGYMYRMGGFNGSRLDDVYYASLLSRSTYWGLGVPAGTPSSTYTGTVTYTAVYTP